MAIIITRSSLGWWVASRANSSKENKSSNNFSHEYVVGLNYLLNDD